MVVVVEVMVDKGGTEGNAVSSSCDSSEESNQGVHAHVMYQQNRCSHRRLQKLGPTSSQVVPLCLCMTAPSRCCLKAGWRYSAPVQSQSRALHPAAGCWRAHLRHQTTPIRVDARHRCQN